MRPVEPGGGDSQPKRRGRLHFGRRPPDRTTHALWQNDRKPLVDNTLHLPDRFRNTEIGDAAQQIGGSIATVAFERVCCAGPAIAVGAGPHRTGYNVRLVPMRNPGEAYRATAYRCLRTAVMSQQAGAARGANLVSVPGVPLDLTPARTHDGPRRTAARHHRCGSRCAWAGSHRGRARRISATALEFRAR